MWMVPAGVMRKWCLLFGNQEVRLSDRILSSCTTLVRQWWQEYDTVSVVDDGRVAPHSHSVGSITLKRAYRLFIGDA